MTRKTKNVKQIFASKEKIYAAFTEPKALESWLVPGEMKGKVHAFDLRVGGGYEMSLYYPESAHSAEGKTDANEDRYMTTFTILEPFDKIVQTIHFQSTDEKFGGEMTMSVTLQTVGNQTEVAIEFDNIPIGIALKDNEDGTESSLEKLVAYVQ